jgi:hypothetical protein
MTAHTKCWAGSRGAAQTTPTTPGRTQAPPRRVTSDRSASEPAQATKAVNERRVAHRLRLPAKWSLVREKELDRGSYSYRAGKRERLTKLPERDSCCDRVARHGV